MSEEYLRAKIIKRPMKRKWRIKKREQAGFTRYRIVECLKKKGRPMLPTEIAWELDMTLQALVNHLRVLRDNEVICPDIDMSDGRTYYTICPACPMFEECENKLPFWEEALKDETRG